MDLDQPFNISDVVLDPDGKVTSLKWSTPNVSQTVTSDIDDDGCAHVYLAPIYSNYHFVNFHLAPHGDPSGNASYISTRKLIVLGNSETTDGRVGDIVSEFKDATFYRFVGWRYYDTDEANWKFIQTVNDDETEPNNVAGKTGAYLTATAKNYDLYPEYIEVRWVTFNRGAAHNGSDYLMPLSIRTSDHEEEKYPVDKFYGKDEAIRVGYDFKGWYLNACLGDGNEILNIDNSYDYQVKDKDGNVTETIHYTKAIQLTDENGNFVNDVKGKKFYSVTGSTDSSLNGGKPMFEVTSDGKFYVYTGLNQRLSVGARWEPKVGTYRVVIWQQKVTDGLDALDLSQYDSWVESYKASHPTAKADEIEAAWDAVCKHYEYYTYNTYTALGGTRVSPSPSDLQYVTSNPDEKFTGFKLNEYYDRDVELDPQGSTVLNVYYDRIAFTLTFQDYVYTQGNGSYGLQDGVYVLLKSSGGRYYYLRTANSATEGNPVGADALIYTQNGNTTTNPNYGNGQRYAGRYDR